MRCRLHGCVAAILVAAALPARAEPQKTVRVLVMDLRSNGVDAEVVQTISGLIAVILSENVALDVLAGQDVKQIVALEGDKQALGCDSSSCLAEVAGAMGAELVVFGDAGKLGTLLNLNLNVFDSAKAKSVGRVALQAKSLEELPEKLKPALDSVVKKVLAERRPPAPTSVPTTTVAMVAEAPPAAPSPPAPTFLPWIVTGAGGALVVGGAAAMGLAFVPASQISSAERRYADGDASALADAKGWQGWYGGGVQTLFFGGLVATGAGFAVAGAGAVWGVLGSESE